MVARSPRDALIPAWVQGVVQQLCGVSRVGAGNHRCHVYQCPGPLNRQREDTVVLMIQSPGALVLAGGGGGPGIAAARSSRVMACSSRGRARAESVNLNEAPLRGSYCVLIAVGTALAG